MPSDIRSRSRQRLSALFGRARSSSRSRQEPVAEPVERSFEATGRNRLIKERSSKGNGNAPVAAAGTTSPTVAYPPSSFRGPLGADAGIERRMSWASGTSAGSVVSLPDSVKAEAGKKESRPASVRSRESSRPASVYSIPYEQTRHSSGDLLGEAVIAKAHAQPEKQKKLRRRSWLPRGSKEKTNVITEPVPTAWVAGDPTRIQYNLSPLTAGERVQELWDDAGDTLVYLFPRSSAKGPSFKVRSSLYACSQQLRQLAQSGTKEGGRGLSTEKRKSQAIDGPTHMMHYGGLATPPLTPKMSNPDNISMVSSKGTRASETTLDEPRQFSLYLPLSLDPDHGHRTAPSVELPISSEHVEQLIAFRNLFAFLVGQSLVATARRPVLFHIFMNISNSLRSYEFTNVDGSTFGEVAESSFECYTDELEMADMRNSREKVIDALILGERMKSGTLFAQAFAHAVGRYDDLQQFAKAGGPSSKYTLVTQTTRSRLERASIDLFYREKSVNTRLHDFEFPSLFAGILDSRTADERKHFSFGAWRDTFLSTRKHVLSYYKQKYGSWPPRRTSKKNDFAPSGLNRMVLRDLYDDFSNVYDLYVDRGSRTTRSSDPAFPSSISDDTEVEHTVRKVLRRVFDEYDRSSPPVQPPIPFDTPRLPRLSSMNDPMKRSRKLKDEEIAALLAESVNQDTLSRAVPEQSQFLTSIRWFERREARGKNLAEIINLRAGMWMFMYVVLQALPMLVIDAPGMRHSQGVEYFLCEPPRSGLPWMTTASDAGTGRGRTAKSWYGIPGGSGMVNFPGDVVDHGVEGIYRRSHCWLRAIEWSEMLKRKEMLQPSEREQQVRAGVMEMKQDGKTTTSSLSLPATRTGSALSSRIDSSHRQTHPHPEDRPHSYIPHEVLRLPRIFTESIGDASNMLVESPSNLASGSTVITPSYNPFSGRPSSISSTASSTPVSASDWPSPPLGGTSGFPQNPGTTSSTPPAHGSHDRPLSYQLIDSGPAPSALPLYQISNSPSPQLVPEKSPKRNTAIPPERRRSNPMAYTCFASPSPQPPPALVEQPHYYLAQQHSRSHPQPQPGSDLYRQQQKQSSLESQHFTAPRYIPAQPYSQAQFESPSEIQQHKQLLQRPSSAEPSTNKLIRTSTRPRNSSQGATPTSSVPSGALSPSRNVASPSSWRGFADLTPKSYSTAPDHTMATSNPGSPRQHPQNPRSLSAGSKDSFTGSDPQALPVHRGLIGKERPVSGASTPDVGFRTDNQASRGGKATFDEIFAGMEQERGRTSWRERIVGNSRGRV